jgi:hypothetical protein
MYIMRWPTSLIAEEIRLAPFIYVKDLKDKVESILEQKVRYTTHEPIADCHKPEGLKVIGDKYVEDIGKLENHVWK